MVDPTECENIYLEEIFSYLNFNDEYNFIVGRVNNINEIRQFEESIIDGKKNIFIMKSDEAGIIAPFFNRLHLVFRMYNNNQLVDYKKIFPIPCGFSRCFNQNNSINVYEPTKVEKKPLRNRHYDLFYSGQRSYKRTPMIDAVNNLEKKYKILINETDRFADGYNLNEYYSYLSDTKIALVPEGAVIPESFRYFESFERNCIVITTFPRNDYFNNWYYENSPAIFLNSWEDLNETIIDNALNEIDFFENENKKYFDNYISPKAVAEYIEKTINNKNFGE